MKKFRRFLACLLAICLFCSVLTGCSLLEDIFDRQDSREDREDDDDDDRRGSGWNGFINQEDDDTQPAAAVTEDTEPATEPATEPTTEPPTEAPTEEEERPAGWDSFYKFWDYENAVFEDSDVATYQAVTGVPCEFSAYDWAFLEEDYSDMVEGYDEGRGVFVYAYDWDSLDLYFEYLETVGFTAYLTQEYVEGTSYYYENKVTGFFLDIFVASDSSYVAIEPYLNADPA